MGLKRFIYFGLFYEFMSFSKICKNIKDLKIQGAQNVAIAGLKAISLKNDKKSVKKVLGLRETEPLLKNSIKFVMKDFDRNYKIAMDHLKSSREKIAEIGYKKFKGKKVFTHCHSSTVVEILKKAKVKRVFNTETRPLYQGRKTAKDLKEAKVEHYVDSGGKIALGRSDIMLIGCDGLCKKYVVNKIGSSMFVDIAKNLKKKVYVCGDSWKICNEIKIEERDGSEIWKNNLKNVTVKNIAFDKIDNGLVDGIISELGIYNPKKFMMEVRKKYPEIF
ncbi:hypothetical protein CL618_00035 [archaeon]|nr:hypothetical protein [archaeon]|tara:strand:- start:692 stop:1519 length:828 start_codon:yes stop_codon:yes gene_type:complete